MSIFKKSLNCRSLHRSVDLIATFVSERQLKKFSMQNIAPYLIFNDPKAIHVLSRNPFRRKHFYWSDKKLLFSTKDSFGTTKFKALLATKTTSTATIGVPCLLGQQDKIWTKLIWCWTSKWANAKRAIVTVVLFGHHRSVNCANVNTA